MNRKRGFWIAVWVVLLAITGFLAFAYGHVGMGYGPWHGWGPMGAWDMDGDHHERGAHGWYGMGPGMMGSYGGMMGGGYAVIPWRRLDLTAEQAEKIGQLQSELIQRNLGVMQQSVALQARLNRLYAAEKRDWNAIRTTSQNLFDLQRQQMDAATDVQQKVDGLLTDDQRLQMAQAWRSHGWIGSQ